MTGSCEGAGYNETCNETIACDPTELECATNGTGLCICNQTTHWDNNTDCIASKDTYSILPCCIHVLQCNFKGLELF